jgi:polyferredoxin
VRRPTIFGWLLIVSGLATIVLALVLPVAAFATGLVFALLLLTLLAEGTTGDLPLGTMQDLQMWDERKRNALTRRFKRGRPEWAKTPPDHADEPADAAWERERKRRGLG